MIKVIAFDLVGVLVGIRNVDTTKERAKLESLFADFDEEPSLERSELIKRATLDLFNKRFEIRNPKLFSYLKDKYNIRIVIASNYASYITEYLKEAFNPDNIFLSSVIGVAKPSQDYFKYILDKENINPDELLFLDDREGNILSAQELGIRTIKVYPETNIVEEIEKHMI